MHFVKICKNKKSPPSDQVITAAMTACGGTVAAILHEADCKKVDFTGTVNHNRFENALIAAVTGANKQSWNFDWADA